MEPYFSCFLERSVSSEEKKLSFRTLIKIHPNFPRSLLSAQVCFDDASHARICSKKNGVYDVPRRGGALHWSLKYSRSNNVGCLRYKWNLDQSSCISATARSRRAIFTSLKTIIGSTGIISDMFLLLSTIYIQ